MATLYSIDNDTPYSLGVGMWSRDCNIAYRGPAGTLKPAKCGSTAINPITPTRPSTATSQAGFARETQNMMLDHIPTDKESV